EKLKNHKIVDGIVELVTWREKIKRMMPKWLGSRLLMFKNGQWIGLFLIILLGYIIEKIVRVFLAKKAVEFLSKKEIPFNKSKQSSLTFPFGIIAIACVWLLGVRTLEFGDEFLTF